MSLLDRLLGRSVGEDRPPKPDPDVEHHEKEIPIYEATLTFVDGAQEQRAVVRTDPEDSGYRLVSGEPRARYGGVGVRGEGEFVPYETLARPPETEQIGHWEVGYERTREYCWRHGRWQRKTGSDFEVLDVEEVREDAEDTEAGD